MLVRLFAWLPLAAILTAQEPESPYQAAMAAMKASLQQQRQSVRRQIGSAEAAPDPFFTVSWPAWPAIPSAAASILEPGMHQTLESPPSCDPISPDQLQEHIEQVAAREGLTPDLLRAVINRESAFQPCAVSSKGAQGLMQLMPETAADLGVRDPFDPQENIDAGARYLGRMLIRYGGNVALALGAYNAGPTRVDQYHSLPPIPETLNYVANILGDIGHSSAPQP